MNGENYEKCMDSDNLHRRLKKIIGQVQAIDRMIDEDVPCEDILSQLNAAKSALNKCGQVVLEGHINHCIKDALERLAKVKRVTFALNFRRGSRCPKIAFWQSKFPKNGSLSINYCDIFEKIV